MRRSITVLNILLAIALTYSPVAAAQQSAASGEWGVVKDLPVREEIIVNLRDGRTQRGKLTGATDAALSISGKNNKIETFNRNDVFQVYLSKGKASKAKYALIGAGVGAAVGGGAGAAKNSPNIDDGEIYTMIGIPVGAGIGALVGFLFGQGRRKRVLIYQAG